jgi:hypothetical protein
LGSTTASTAFFNAFPAVVLPAIGCPNVIAKTEAKSLAKHFGDNFLKFSAVKSG